MDERLPFSSNSPDRNIGTKDARASIDPLVSHESPSPNPTIRLHNPPKTFTYLKVEPLSDSVEFFCTSSSLSDETNNGQTQITRNPHLSKLDIGPLDKNLPNKLYPND